MSTVGCLEKKDLLQALCAHYGVSVSSDGDTAADPPVGGGETGPHDSASLGEGHRWASCKDARC